MCFTSEMKDILEKKKPIQATEDTLNWYLEDMLLSYKFNMKDSFFRDLFALKPYLNPDVYASLLRIGNLHSWKGGNY